MCDCFHVVLPTWPGAPGSVSGRQLQPQEPGAATQEEHSVTEGPVDELIRPRPQGSSPVYECTTEGTGFGLQEDAPGQRGTSGRRRSWWKWDSGDSRVFSRMSHPEAVQEAAEVTLHTEVEAGASGYSVTGGGHQGIFVKQVLKDSSAAKLFNLREGDQLLSATIFFDDIKYEDALKILQYSEPYKIQFKIKRKPLAPDGEGLAASGPQQASQGKEQDQDVADECTETPTKTLEADGDRERLISKPRVSRGRRPQERLSWPKFQAIKSKRGPRPQRSHSSSEAYEPGGAPDVSPTSTDTEAQLPEELQEQTAGQGRQRRRKFLNFRFKMGSGQEPSATGNVGREAQGRSHPARVLEEMGPQDDGPEDMGAAAGAKREGTAKSQEGLPEWPVQQQVEPGLPAHVPGDRAPGEGAGMAVRSQRKTQQVSGRHQAGTHSEHRPGTDTGPERSWEQEWEEVQSLETGIARLSLLDTGDPGSARTHLPGTQLQVRDIKTPRFGITKEKVIDTERGDEELDQRERKQTSPGEDEGSKTEATTEHTPAGKEPKAYGAEREEEQEETLKAKAETLEDKDKDRREARMKMPRVKRSSWGGSKSKEGRASASRLGREGKQDQNQEDKGEDVRIDIMSTEPEEILTEDEESQKKLITTPKKDTKTMEKTIKKKDREKAAKDSKFKMPKFKMPSFSVSTPGKAMNASVQVKEPKVEADMALPSLQGDLKSSDLSTQLPTVDLQTGAGQVEMMLPKAALPKRELPVPPAAGAELKGHLPKVQMPSIRMPKVELKGPQVDVKGPRLDLKGPKGEVSALTLEVGLPSVQVDIQAPSTKLDGDLAQVDKDDASKDSKFKMPKFKMPSFSVSAPGKALDASMEVKPPKVEADVALPSIQGDLKSSDLSIHLPSSDLEARSGQMAVTLPEAALPQGELPAAPAAGVSLKGHLPKVQTPSIKMPKVDIKSPQMDIKDPKLDLKGPKAEVSAPALDVELPSVQVDIQAPSTKLDGDLAQVDKDDASKDSKFKMPKFKMPSFGVSAPGEALDTSLEVKVPKVETDVALPSLQDDLRGFEVSIQLPTTDPEAGAGEGELCNAPAPGVSLKGHLPKVPMPSIKMPKVDLKGTKLDLKRSKVEMSTATLDVELPATQVDIQAPSTKMDGDLALADKDGASKDSKFKMPKFKMPSFSVSTPGKTLDASMEVKVPKVEADVTLPSLQGDLKSPDLSIQPPATDLEARADQIAVTLPEAALPEGELPTAPAAGVSLKGHLPKVQMPSIKIPTVDVKGPQVDVKGPKAEMSSPAVDVELPSVQVDIQATGTKLDGDLALADKDGASKDSKFKMPKFKMPSFGVSTPRKALDSSMEVKAPKMEADVTLPSLQGDLKSSDLSIQPPATDLEVSAGQMAVTLTEATLPEGELPAAPAAEVSLKGHLPKVQMLSIKMPKVDVKGPQVDIKGPKWDLKGTKGKVSTPALDVELSSVLVDIQAPVTKLEGDLALTDKDSASKDSKFKMPKFKMPSFGVSAPGKALDASMEVKPPKVEADVALPFVQGDLKSSDLSIKLTTADLEAGAGQVAVTVPEAALPEGELPATPAAGVSLKGHLPKVQMPSVKMPNMDLKGSQVDVKGPNLDLKGPKAEVSVTALDVELPSVQVDIQATGTKLDGDLAQTDKDGATKDSKFKMPKFKMPSFGVSAPGKALDASMEVKPPKVEADVALPFVQGDLKSSDLSIKLTTADLEAGAGQVAVTLPEAALPEGELPAAPAAGVSLKGHLPKVQMPSVKMPRVDVKGPQVDIKGPKLDLKGPKAEVSAPALDVELPSVQVDIRAPGTKLEGDLTLADKDGASKDSKFKMPKFKMPSFSVSTSGKTLDASVEVKVPKVEADVTLPSLQGDLKSPDLSIQPPATDLEARADQIAVTLPEAALPEGELPTAPAAGVSLKGHLPKVQMPSIKMPTVDVKGPQVDVKGPKAEMSSPAVDVELPSVQVDIQATGTKLDGDLALADKDGAFKDSKFKMPKFKMPSFSVSTPGKTLDASMEVKVPKVEADVTLPSLQGDLKSPDLSIQPPATDLEARADQIAVTLPEAALPEGELPTAPAAGVSLKGHLPKVQMPSIKMPTVDVKGPQVDGKGPKAEMSSPAVDVELPSVQVDIQATGTKLDGDLALADKDGASKDSKFKMPKFKMPSFGVSTPRKALDSSMEVKAPKMEADVTLPSLQGDLKSSDLSIQPPATDLEVSAGQMAVTLTEATLPEGELPAAPAAEVSLKGHLPKVQMLSIKMPKVDVKGPQVDIKGPKWDLKGTKGKVSTPALDVELSSVLVDIQAPVTKLEGDLALTDKDSASKDSKFKMPKFKMPSFGVSAPGKALDASMEVKPPKVEADVALPFVQGDLKSSDLSIKLTTADLEAGAGQVAVTVPEAALPEGELPAAPAAGVSLKGHLPKVQMPSVKMPRVDVKGPQVDIKGPKLDLKGPKAKVSAPALDVELPSVQVDIQAPVTKLEGDLALTDKDSASKDSKFKMPKFKMPSFGVSSHGKALDTSLEVKAPRVEADVALPSLQGDLSIQMPTANLEAEAGQVVVTVPEAALPEGELPATPAAGVSLKGHLPKVQMPSVKMPNMDLKGSQVDVKGPNLDLKGPKAEVSVTALDVELPSVQVDIQATGTKLDGDLAQTDKDGATKDSKFKMPKFKMPSFGVSAPGKALDASMEVKPPKVEADVALPFVQGDLKSSDLSIKLTTTDLEAGAGQVAVTVPEAALPEGELPAAPAAGVSLKGHLPKVQMPSVKMPRVDVKGPQVDIKGPKLDLKGPKAEVSAPALDVELPSVQVDIQVPGTKLEGDLTLADKDGASKDSKFKMPKFKMPSFGVSAPGEALDTSLEVKVPKVETDVALPSLQDDLRGFEVSIQLPTTDPETGAGEVVVTLPEAALPEGELCNAPAPGVSLKGHLPKVPMPSIKMPKVDLKGPKLDLKRPKVEMSTATLDVELPATQVDIQAPSTKTDGDLALADKDSASKDSKFKMPKFKMPSFGVSAPGKAFDASMEVKPPKVEADVTLPSLQGDLKSPDLSIQPPATDLEARAGQIAVTLPEAALPEGELPTAPAAGVSLKGHLPKVQMPSIKMPTVDVKGPQVDGKGPKAEMSSPAVDVELPSVQVDIQATGTKLDGDLALADKDGGSKDSKFKMPKFKMPPLSVSAPGKTLDASMEVKVPKVEADEAMPSVKGDLKSSDLTIQLPTSDVEARAGQMAVTLPEAALPEGELPAAPAAGVSLKGHLPKVQMPSIKMPTVDVKGPQVDGKGLKAEMSSPTMDVQLPSVQVDIQPTGTKVEGDQALADKDGASKDSKFKMPKFKMPTFSVSAPGKALDVSLEVKAPKVEADVALPSVQGDLKSSDLSIQMPASDVEVSAGQMAVTLSQAAVPEGEVPAAPAAGVSLKGHLPKVQMPSIKMPKVDIKGPQVDVKGPKLDLREPKGKLSAPAVDVELPSVQVDMQAPGTKLDGDLAPVDKDGSSKDSKFKMPKFKMPSFGMSTPRKALDSSLEVKAPKMEADVALPSLQGDLKSTDLSIQPPATDLEVSAGQMVVTLTEATLPEGELPAAPAAGVSMKGHLSKVQMPSIKMPKVDLKGPQVEVKGPKLDLKGPKAEVSVTALDVELPSMQVDIQATGTKLEGDLAQADKDGASKDSKFKMPKFKMPSFGVSTPGKALDTSKEGKPPKVEADVALPFIQGDLNSSDLNIQLPAADVEARAGQVVVTLPEAALPEVELPTEPAAGVSLKGHLPKVQMPSIKMPKVDLKGPQVEVKGPKLDLKEPKGKLSAPTMGLELPSVQVDIQTPVTKLEGDLALTDKDSASKDSKFKMPKFKMPSFGVSSHGKALDTSLEVKAPKVEADVALPSLQGDLSIQMPTANLEAEAGQMVVTVPKAALPEGELPTVPAAGVSLKGHLPKVQMPSIKLPNMDLKGPQVDIEGPKLNLKSPKCEMRTAIVDVELPSIQVDIQAPGTRLDDDLALADKDGPSKDSKFKMPKFKMPSFGVSAPGKALDASMEVKVPKMEADVALPFVQGDLKSSDLSVRPPATDLEVSAGQIAVTLPEAALPEGELPAAPAAGVSLKGHLPKVQMPSIKMHAVDAKGPQVDVKGPKLDVKGPKGKMSAPALDVELPSLQVDIQTLGTKLDRDLALADKDSASKDSKFKVPKFKMSSFGVSAPQKALEASLEVKVPKVEANMALPSVQDDLKSSDLSIQLTSADVEAGSGQVALTLPKAALPEGELPAAPAAGVSLKGHLPKVQMPSIKMPKVDLKGPQVDVKVSKLDLKGPKGKVSTPAPDVELPSVQVDIQASGTILEGNLALADKDGASKDSKFKMPKFKMPSFSVSSHGKTLDTSLEVKVPKMEADMALPSLQGDLSIQLPTADLEARAGQVAMTLPEAALPEGELPAAPAAGVSLKGHLPKVQMPSIKMPNVDLKGPQVDVKGPKLDLKGPKAEVSVTALDVELPSVQVDIQVPGTKLDGDLPLADKDGPSKDSKFKMPKFKMPSFGVPTTGKALEASLEVKVPKVEADVALPSLQGDLKSSDLSIQLPAADLEVGAGHVPVTLPEGALPEGELPTVPAAGVSLKGHLPKVQMPSIKMPNVDLEGPQVDVKGPKLDLKEPKSKVSTRTLDEVLPSVQVDIQASGTKLEGDLALADKDGASKDSKFKMPKFKMPSFGVAATGKGLDTSLEVKAPKVEADVALPSLQGDLKSSDLSIQLPAVDVEAGSGQVDESSLSKGELPAASAAGVSLKGHLPKVQMPSIKMPKVDLKGPQVDVKCPKVDLKGPKCEMSTSALDVQLPSLQADIQALGTKLDVSLVDKDGASKDSKFKMPKFKMPSFGVSAPLTPSDVSLDVKIPKVEADVALPSLQGDLKSSDLSIQLPAVDVEAGSGQMVVTLPEAALPEGELPTAPAAGVSLKGHLPKVQMPSIKMPKVDLKGPQVDIKGPKLDLKGSKGEMSAPAVDVDLSSMQLDIQAPGTVLEAELGLAGQDGLTEGCHFKSGDSEMCVSKLELEGECQTPHFKFSRFFHSHRKSSRDIAGMEEPSGACLLSVSSTSSSEVPCVSSQEPSVSGVTPSVNVPRFLKSDLTLAGVAAAPRLSGASISLDSAGRPLSPHLEPSSPPRPSAECPPLSCSSPHPVPSPGFESSAILPATVAIPMPLPEHQPGPEGPLLPAFHAHVTFPKYHKPKFVVSGATVAVAEAAAAVAEDSPGLSPLCPVDRVDSSGQCATVTSLPAPQPLALGVPRMEEDLGPSVTGAPAEDAHHDGKGSPFKMPRLKLPSFSRSPKKEAVVTGDSGGPPEDSMLSLVVETEPQLGVQFSQMEAQMNLPPEKDRERGALKRPAFAMPRLLLPRLKASKGRESLPPGDVDTAFSNTTDGHDSEATEKAIHDGGQGDTGVMAGPPGRDGGHIQVPQAHVPSVGFTKPNLSTSTAKVEVSLSKAALHLPEHDLAVRGDNKSGLGDASVSQSHGERTALTTQLEDVPTAGSPEEGNASRETLEGSQELWCKMPALHVPGLGHPSSREPGRPREQDAAKTYKPVAPVPAEASPGPGSKAEASVSPLPPEAETAATAPEGESYADVPRRHVESPGLMLHLPAMPVSESGLPSPRGRTHLAEGSLPLQIPGVRPSEPQAPPGEACLQPLPRPGGCDLTKAETRTETWSFQPEGPVKLKASSTHVPSQVSVVSVDQLWEDSVLTVTFPKLKVPRFSFPVPSSEADVFFPVVRALPCTEAGTQPGAQDSPELWGASLLRATGTAVPGGRPEGSNLSSEASPVSKVRVHIQEPWGESQGVTVCSRVTGECSDLAAPEAFSTQIVRESEIVTSTVQMPSYGFSLLKVKIPEAPAQASVYTGAQGSTTLEHSGGAPGGDAVPGGLQPDTGEPFEMISASSNLPGPQTFLSEACSGLQLADSSSDEEPAEILEFSFDDSQEATAPLAGEDGAPKENPAGKKASGLLWSWLPNIGFSSVDEPSADVRDGAQRSAPVQTQPGARPDPEPAKKQERAGWFRFPRLGFSSSPAKKSKSMEDEAGQKLQEETATFFDARESFSPEEEDDEVAAGAAGAGQGSRVKVASSARTELILLEHSKSAGEEPAPRPMTE